MNIAFFVRHFTERGTEVAIYDYAKYNEEVLNNKSYIICFTEKKQKETGFPTERTSYDKFNKRFTIIEICDIGEMDYVIDRYNLQFFYTLTHGGPNDIYIFENKAIWGNCKTIKHCVFDSSCPESDFCIGISNFLNTKCNTTIPIIPHIVELPTCDDNLRSEINIPQDAIVLGRHGGFMEFNIKEVHQAIIEFLNLPSSENVWFLFLNTQEFYKHPRIIYLDRTRDEKYKEKMVNTCNVMIHARNHGEMFGLSIAEFSIKNKPVITCPIGDLGHIEILGDKAILYRSKEDLLDIFNNIKNIIKNKDDWNAYRQYTPENVMQLFNELVFSR
jgi:glycosyltransferase involved in cell wall biosynthesis